MSQNAPSEVLQQWIAALSADASKLPPRESEIDHTHKSADAGLETREIEDKGYNAFQMFVDLMATSTTLDPMPLEPLPEPDTKRSKPYARNDYHDDYVPRTEINKLSECPSLKKRRLQVCNSAEQG